MTAAAQPFVAAARATRDGSHVFAALPGLEEQARRLAAAVDPAFLAEAGWDASRWVLAPPAEHPLLGRPVCRVPDCPTTAPARGRVCAACRRRLADQGVEIDNVEALPPRPDAPRGRPGSCAVAGCAREWASSRHQLCRAHHDQARALRLSPVELCAHPAIEPLAACELCAVAACERQRRYPDASYCHAHQQQLRTARRTAGFEEARWRLTAAPVGCGGEVSLRGLPPVVVAELLVGLQQRCRLDEVQTADADLRGWCNELRVQQVAALADSRMPASHHGSFQAMCNAVTAHARRALSTPETEIVGDEWDLVVFGHSGTLSFTDLSQRWLREVAKRWAAEDLPRRRSTAGRAHLTVRHHLGCVARLSESLRMRDDRGERPGELGRADMEAFLNRLAYQESTGQLTADARIRACREVRTVLSAARAMGLTRPGGPAAGLGEDFAIARDDVPEAPERAEPGRDLPGEILRQVCAHLDALTNPEMRTGIELAIDTGRRPEELCTLAYDCLARDDDGQPVLIYHNHKGHRLGRRVPISETTAAVISTQQQRVRARYPDTPVGELVLLPTSRRNPDGRKPITAFSLGFAHRRWVERMPVLVTADGAEFDKRKLVLYAYRHTYAQRHADAGVGVEVLRELMGHRRLEATTAYYRVGEDRRREAVDRVTTLQFDRHGNRIWRAAQQLLDSEHTRRAVGEVAVPFGVCTEPSNVKAGGTACPFRFRCAGCDHFRTDVSYLPDLQAYLEDLLRNRERVLAATDLDPWAQADALPSDEEITGIRRLIGRIHAGLDELTDDERARITEAVDTVRRHRTATLAAPRIRQTLPVLSPERHP